MAALREALRILARASAPRQGEMNALRMFAGPMAKTADHQALSRAQEMAGQGATRDAIWRDTGWFQGVDGKWRFEIDDSGATISHNAAVQRRMGAANAESELVFDASVVRNRSENLGISLDDARAQIESELRRPVPEEAMEMARSTRGNVLRDRYNRLEDQTSTRGARLAAHDMTIGETTTHPELFAAYPDIADRPHGAPALGLGYGGRGGYSEADDALYTSQFLNAAEERSTGLHELQHSVQGREEFARGGNARQHFDYDAPEVRALQSQRDAVEAEMATMTVLDPRFDALNRRAAELSEQMDRQAGFAGYRRLGGEVEARNVETRRDFTPEERRSRPPWETQDVPDDQQIVRFDGDRASNALGDILRASAGLGGVALAGDITLRELLREQRARRTNPAT